MACLAKNMNARHVPRPPAAEAAARRALPLLPPPGTGAVAAAAAAHTVRLAARAAAAAGHGPADAGPSADTAPAPPSQSAALLTPARGHLSAQKSAPFDFSALKGRPALVVNVASQCGLTAQA